MPAALKQLPPAMMQNLDPLALVVFLACAIFQSMTGQTIDPVYMAAGMALAAAARTLWERGKAKDLAGVLAELDHARAEAEKLRQALAAKPAEMPESPSVPTDVAP